MKKALKITGLILLLLAVGAAVAWFGFLRPEPPAISAEDRAEIELMPLPAKLSLGEGNFVIQSVHLGHSFTMVSSPEMEQAVERYYDKLLSKVSANRKNILKTTLFLECKNRNKDYPSLVDDESYQISVTEEEIRLTANSETGILHGLETLLQSVKKEGKNWIIPVMEIEDKPRYTWRGLMIDVARHWIPKEVILRNLDAMAAVKMNVFHWHLTEYQGFRIESKLFPKLHEMGSGGDFYTQEEVKEIVKYAADRGIRVVPEFDVPGHSTAWFVGYPELAAAAGPYEIETKFGVLAPVMDPTKDEVYDFLDRFIGEMAGLFPDEYLHIGGDEVNPKHWDENPDIQEFMKENKLKDAHELQAYFNIRLQKIVEKHGKKMMGWDEIIHPDLPKNKIAVQSWRNHKSLWEAARSGHKAVLSAGYYLDHKQSAGFHYQTDPAVIRGAVTIEIDSTDWRSWDCLMELNETKFEGQLYLFGKGKNLRGIMTFMDNASGFSEATEKDGKLIFGFETPFGQINYELNAAGDSLNGTANIALFSLKVSGLRSGGTDRENGVPLPKFDKIEPLSPEEEANILGGEACMWTEMADQITLESRIWPRAAAVAEKLWSPKELTDNEDDMYRRLMVLDDKLEAGGLMHRAGSRNLLRKMTEEIYWEPLQVLADVLQEDLLFNRMKIYTPELYTFTPLNRPVDAAAPESYPAYRFGKDVTFWSETKDPAAEKRILGNLEKWASNHEKLAPAFERDSLLADVEKHSFYLSETAKTALAKMQGKPLPAGPELKALTDSAEIARGATLLSVAGSLRKLIVGTE